VGKERFYDSSFVDFEIVVVIDVVNFLQNFFYTKRVLRIKENISAKMFWLLFVTIEPTITFFRVGSRSRTNYADMSRR